MLWPDCLNTHYIIEKIVQFRAMDEITSLEISQEKAADLKLTLVVAGQMDEDETLQVFITWFLNRLKDVKKTDTTGQIS